LPAALSHEHIMRSGANGEADSSIAERVQLTRAAVGKWRARLIERLIVGLYDDVHPGPPPNSGDERGSA
jgi:putative transposase